MVRDARAKSSLGYLVAIQILLIGAGPAAHSLPGLGHDHVASMKQCGSEWEASTPHESLKASAAHCPVCEYLSQAVTLPDASGLAGQPLPGSISSVPSCGIPPTALWIPHSPRAPPRVAL